MLDRDAPKLGRPKLPGREGLTRDPPTPERPKAPPRDAPLPDRLTLGRLVPPLARPRLGRGVLGRGAAPVRAGTVPTRPSDVGDVDARPRLAVSTRVALGRVRLTPVVRGLGTRPTTEVRGGALGARPTVDVRVGVLGARPTVEVCVGVRDTAPVRVGALPTRPTVPVRP